MSPIDKNLKNIYTSIDQRRGYKIGEIFVLKRLILVSKTSLNMFTSGSFIVSDLRLLHEILKRKRLHESGAAYYSAVVSHAEHMGFCAQH